MLYFENDYCEGAHEAILKRLMETNMEKVPGYGQDPFCDQAKEKIKEACGCPDGEVYFLVGGTQTNAVVIASVLNRYEGVLSAVTGHVNAHEAGAIEFTGHKVLELPQKDGKICAADLRKLAERFYGDENHEHMVFPGMVYISHPTEYGTLLSAEDASLMQTFMREVVEDGTGERLLGQSYAASGKTGTAEFSTSSKASHAWFVGYAHREDKEDIAVAVIVEDSGSGSEYAVPIAKKIFDAYYQ